MKTGNRGGRRRRRDLLGLCAAALLASGAAGAWPLAAPAQQPAKVPRVGWIWAGRSAGNPTEVAGFRQGLKELGYIEGQNVVVEYRFGEDRHDRVADLAAELVQLHPDVLVAIGDFKIRAGKGGELLQDALPAAPRIGLIYSRYNPSTVKSLDQGEQVASQLGFVIRPF